jgi:serine phosphatase RsbU (regulator of sigma subunit)
MNNLTVRISEALAHEEARAERFANNVRLVLLCVLTAVAATNAMSVSADANILNFSIIAIGYAYGFIVFLRIRRKGYHPAMKYLTSCFDVLLVMLLLILYTRIEIPSGALKNYVFFTLYPLVALTTFRYDRRLTLVAGGLAVVLYLGLICYLLGSHRITLTDGGYERELFSSEVTYIGQITKLLIFIGYALLLAYLAQYSRTLFAKLVTQELSLRSQKEMTDWELNIASQVQTRFLPHAYPAIAGLDICGAVQQGKFVGGDYYDFIKVADDTLLMVVADVSGKGVPAALIMAEVRASTHVLAPVQRDLEAFVRRLNALIYQSTDKKHFVTLCVAEFNTSSGVLSYVNAGHPPPLIYAGGRVRPLSKGTLPLGMFADIPHLTKHDEQLHPGSMLIAYTDGLVEQTNLQEEQFGEERLHKCICATEGGDAQSMTRGLLEAARTFAGAEALQDDVSVAVVRYKPISIR